MKFLNIIPQLLVDAVKIGLATSILAFGCVRGDVFELQNLPIGDEGANVPITVDNVADFVAFITANPNALPVGARDPFVGPIATNQMIGYAVFFPAASAVAQQVYVAKKRNADSTANHNTGNGGNVFNFSNFEHTERQLAIQLATVAAGGVGIANEIAAADEMNSVLVNLPGEIVAGSMHIYARRSPCTEPLSNNNNFSCFSYYAALANYLADHNVQLHVYFKGISIEPNFLTNNVYHRNLLFRAIAAVAPINNRIRITGNDLEYNNTPRAKHSNWLPIAQRMGENNWVMVEEGNLAQFLGHITAILNGTPQNPTHFLTNQAKEQIFTTVYGIHNVTYRVI